MHNFSRKGVEYVGTVCIQMRLSTQYYNNNIILTSLMSVKNPPGTSLGSSGLLWKNLKLILKSILISFIFTSQIKFLTRERRPSFNGCGTVK